MTWSTQLDVDVAILGSQLADKRYYIATEFHLLAPGSVLKSLRDHSPTGRPARFAKRTGVVAALGVGARDGEVSVRLGHWCDGNHVTTWSWWRKLRAVTTARQTPQVPSPPF